MQWTDWLTWASASDYTIAREIIERGVAAIFIVAFASAIAQFPALLGEHGLLPAPAFIARTSAKRFPSLFRWRYSDRMLRLTAAIGIALAASVVLGLPQLGPSWVPLAVFAVMWVFYLSIVNVGQTFYGFGWESLLLEAGAIVGLLGSNEAAPPFLIILFLRWLIFRLEFGAGMIKMRGDRTWRDLTAMYYHHETQPMPNPVSRFAHLLPKPVHRLETLGNHIVQLGMPWLLFFPQPIASFAACLIILTQLWLVISGNFAWLNWITIVIAFCGISDSFFDWITGHGWPGWGWEHIGEGAGGPMPIWWLVLTTLAFLGLAALSWQPVLNLFSRRQLMNASFNRWHLVNAYGAFGSVTQLRREVIVEGTMSDDPGPTDWKPYEFKGKPGDPTRVPRQFAPYHLRLDWLMWFLALGSWDDVWFQRFLQRLLEADAATLRLLRVDPFHGERPRMVRARLFAYRFATREERRRTGLWWMRDELATLVPPSRLR
ncbi:Lipase maturation factor [Paramicrobacterium humi]|uniref:Lipase maturation factor n=1 Tax=Paramicrobacterium humi TaxID=640635 RepID=A0A1H4JLG8_9MICO|nr:lipase maturation factor family protein [Microbacterium humi]SEB46538.1 Lipase maturation factor [Microbacterium humi]